MRKSIFEIETRMDCNEEYKRLIKVFNQGDAIYYKYEYYSFMEFINEHVFDLWHYQGTYLDMYDYLNNHLGISSGLLSGAFSIEENIFLNFIEFMLNMNLTIEKEFDDFDDLRYDSVKLKKVIDFSIPMILEKLNYKICLESDRVIITKRDSDVDSVLEDVDISIAELLLTYNDIRIKDDRQAKANILKQLDLYIEENKVKYQGYNKSLYGDIQFIVNKMGVNHPANDKKIDYGNLNFIEWYDRCFKMMIHLIRFEDVYNVQNSINSLKQK